MSAARAVAPASRVTRDLALPPGAAAFHLGTAVVATAVLLLQVVLAWSAGGEVLPVRLLQLVSHFTVQGTLLVALAAWALWVRPTRGVSTVFRVVRLDGLAGVTVTFLVYLVVLRPVLELDGWAAVADVLAHYVVPVLVVAGWLVYGPRRRVDRRVVLLSLGWPVAFFAWTFAQGAVGGYYPYPFVDVEEHGYGAVLRNAALVLALLLLTAVAFGWLDRRLDARARARVRRPRR